MIAGLLAVIKFKDYKLGKAEDEAELYKAEADRGREYMEDTKELDESLKSHSAEIAHEIEENGYTKELSEPNKWGDE